MKAKPATANDVPPVSEPNPFENYPEKCNQRLRSIGENFPATCELCKGTRCHGSPGGVKGIVQPPKLEDELERRVGRFYISDTMVEHAFKYAHSRKMMAAFMAQLLIVRAEHDYGNRSIGYTAMSPLFAITPLGTRAPVYEFTITTHSFDIPRECCGITTLGGSMYCQRTSGHDGPCAVASIPEDTYSFIATPVSPGGYSTKGFEQWTH